MNVRHLLAAAAVVTIGFSDLSAQAINRRATGLASPAYTLDFNSYAPGAMPGIVRDANFGTVWSAEAPGCSGGPFISISLYNFGCTTSRGIATYSEIYFTSAVTGVAFNLMTNSSASTWFTAFLGGAQVAQFSGFTNLETPERFWYGFENITLDRILILEPTMGVMGIDNLQVAVVPEPSTYALMFAGLMALGLAAKRRKLN